MQQRNTNPRRPTAPCTRTPLVRPWPGHDFFRSSYAIGRRRSWRLPAVPVKAGVGWH